MPPDPHRLAILTDLRKDTGLTLADMARACGLRGNQSHQTAGAWEMGRIIPEEGRRRQAFLHYLWDSLRLRRDPALFERVWDVLVVEWGWQTIDDQEWRSLTSAPRRQERATSVAVAHAPGALFQAPALPPHFVGRATELDLATSWLSDHSTAQPVALVGMGGVGKSTLAAQIAHRMRASFPDGVLWAHLAEGDPLAILQGWAQLFGCDFRALADVENRAAAVRGLLSGRRVLMVLDDARTPERVRPLLPGAPSCAVLLTTRDRQLAELVNARLMDVAELATDHSSALLASLAGAQRVQAEATAARAIAELVGRLPLALEIVGRLLARTPWQSLAEMATQLADAGQRLDRLAIKDVSVRAAFAVSWQNLPPRQRRVFALLGLFQARSFSSAALAATAEMALHQAEECLLELASLSLLSLDGPHRFRQHALLADFAREQLGDPGSAEKRWADYYLHLAQTEESQPIALEADMDNLMAAIEAMHRSGDWPRVLRLVETLHPSWLRLARYSEARRGYGWAADAAAATGEATHEAQIRIRLGFVCSEQGAFAEAEEHLRAGLAAAQRLGATALVADAQFHLARILLEQSELEEADEVLSDCLRARIAAADEAGAARTLREQGLLFYRQGAYRATTAACAEALAIQERLGEVADIVATVRLLADTAMAMGDLEQALMHAQRIMTLAQDEGLLAELAEAHYTLATVQRLRQNFADAERRAEQALELFQRFGNRSYIAYTLHEQSVILKFTGRAAAALPLAEAALAIQEELGDNYGRATTMIQLGDLYRLCGDEAGAQRIWRAGWELAQEIHYPHVEAYRKRLKPV